MSVATTSAAATVASDPRTGTAWMAKRQAMAVELEPSALARSAAR